MTLRLQVVEMYVTSNVAAIVEALGARSLEIATTPKTIPRKARPVPDCKRDSKGP